MRWSGGKGRGKQREAEREREGGRERKRDRDRESKREKAGERAREGFLQHRFSKWQTHRLYGGVAWGLASAAWLRASYGK